MYDINKSWIKEKVDVMNFVLLFVTRPQTTLWDSHYRPSLEVMIEMLKRTQDNPHIIVLSDRPLPYDGVEVRILKDDCPFADVNRPFFEKTRMIEYLTDLKSFFYLDLDMVVLGKIPDFEYDIYADGYLSHNNYSYDDTIDSETIYHIKNTFKIHQFNIFNSYAFGISVNEKTIELFQLANQHYTEQRVYLEEGKLIQYTRKGGGLIPDGPYMTISLSQLISRGVHFNIHGLSFVSHTDSKSQCPTLLYHYFGAKWKKETGAEMVSFLKGSDNLTGRVIVEEASKYINIIMDRINDCKEK